MADDVPIGVRVNGVTRQARVEPRLLLVHFLRETLGLTGTHVGCDTSQCGACAVLLDGAAVKSCTLLAAQADGSEIVTIEGLAASVAIGGARADRTPDAPAASAASTSSAASAGTAGQGAATGTVPLHPLQQAFWEAHGLQCGFCTPGMVIAACDLLQHTPSPTDTEIRHALEGNFCRCTGYHNIVRAVRQAADVLASAR